MYMSGSMFQLAIAGAFTVLITLLLCLLENKTRFGKIKYGARQLIIGAIFGGLAILATHTGIDIGGAAVNVRDAAPLSAGLIFGGPAGIIAGLIGGVERFIAGCCGVGSFTMVACSISTGLAGFVANYVRKYMFDNKKPYWMYGLAAGAVMEVFHMLMILVTHFDSMTEAFTYVKICSLPMILGTAFTVCAALVVAILISHEKLQGKRKTKRITDALQLWLLIVVAAAFGLSIGFSYYTQTQIVNQSTESLLGRNLEDVAGEIEEASDTAILRTTHSIAYEVMFEEEGYLNLDSLAYRFNVEEINLVDENGIIIDSNVEEYIGFDMSSGDQSKKFLSLLDVEDEYVQPYQPITFDSNRKRKYAGVALPKGGFVQVGYGPEQYESELREEFDTAAKFRHFGSTGAMIICDEGYHIVSYEDMSHYGEFLASELWEEARNPRYSGSLIRADILGTASVCRFTETEGFYIISFMSEEEAMLSRDIAIYIIIFMETLIFAAVFVQIYRMMRKLVVNDISRVNESLAKITSGDLDEQVQVTGTEEFAKLSEDINQTVDTLKFYIKDAETRIDKELKFAQDIQHSALPSVFPAFPQRHDFDIYATMNTAKEVGGDFYDFYLIGRTKLALLIADVSGKGIPAAMFMMTAKTLIKSLVEAEDEVNTVFEKANDELCSNNDMDMFVTAWLGVVDLKTGLIKYVNAGHNPPLIRRHNGKFEYLRDKPNLVLAGMPGIKYTQRELSVKPGDEIYLYTDGVTEATDINTEMYGEDRLLSFADRNESNDARSFCKGVMNDLSGFVGEADQFDDITMLDFRLKSLQDGNTVYTAATLDAMEAVVEFADRRLIAENVPERTAKRIKIALDEIYSNISYYSKADFCSIGFKFGRDIEVTFSDNGVEYDSTKTESPDVSLPAEERRIGGLGIHMIRNMSKSMEYKRKAGLNILKIVFAKE